jgi:teichuronic acid biosynthesis glycosyltransferase TuaG
MEKVSILMPLYNAEKFICKSILSVLKQSYHNWELIIINDGSTDASVKKIEKFNSNKIKIFHNKKNLGQQKTRNLLLKKVKGYYIAYLDSDDYWHKHKLKTQIFFMKKNNLDFSYTNYLIKIKKKKIKRQIPRFATYRDLLSENFIGQSTVIYKSKLKKYKFNGNKIRMDFDLWLNILKKIKILHGIGSNLATINLNPGSQSSNFIRNIIFNWNMMRKSQKINLIKTIYYLFIQSFNSLKKRNSHFFKNYNNIQY